MKQYTNIDEYIRQFPNDVQKVLQQVRKTILAAAPAVIETIAYGIPTFKLNGKNLVHFGGYKEHIGFYPTPNGLAQFKEEIKSYESGKGTMQFKLDQPIPYELITKIVQFRVKEISK